MADLVFPIGDGGDWIVFDAVFGVHDGRLMIAQFSSMSTEGVGGHVDKSKYADLLVEDTTKLPGEVFEQIAGDTYQVIGFTVGRADDGTGFVDWVHLLSPTGESIVRTFEPPVPDSETTRLPLCKLREIAVCGDVCSGECVASGTDPCACSATGFCFIDFYIYRCRKLTCPDTCGIFDLETCGCLA